MDRKLSYKNQAAEINIPAIAECIARTQNKTGEIPWHDGGKTDPWDHVEAAIGLAIGGYPAKARLAYEWLAGIQLEDGSWHAAYVDGKPTDKTRETNLSAYIAVGVYHYFLVTGDKVFLTQMWETVSSAIEYAVGLQAPGGEIYWAKSPDLVVDPMALLTGSSSIFMSLKCALAIAGTLGIERPLWRDAALRLKNAVCSGYHLFNITKSHYSMDWFYPVLSGAVTGDEAKKRIDSHWKKFVKEGMGVLCVSDSPWITIAETSELVLALMAAGKTRLAGIVFNWLNDWRFEDGSYWCGFTYPDMVIWPEEKFTWTNAVVLMAADALYHLTPASRLFDHGFWKEMQIPE